MTGLLAADLSVCVWPCVLTFASLSSLALCSVCAQAMGYVSVMESEGVGFNGRVYTVLAKLYFAQRDWKAALALLQVR